MGYTSIASLSLSSLPAACTAMIDKVKEAETILATCTLQAIGKTNVLLFDPTATDVKDAVLLDVPVIAARDKNGEVVKTIETVAEGLANRMQAKRIKFLQANDAESEGLPAIVVLVYTMENVTSVDAEGKATVTGSRPKLLHFAVCPETGYIKRVEKEEK